MGRNNRRTAVLVFLLLVCGAAAGICESGKRTSRLKAAAAIFPVYDIARNIAGERADIVCVIRPGASPHTFELSPSDIKRLRDSKILFSIGHIMDSWTERIAGIIEGVDVYAVNNGIELRPLGSAHDHGEKNSGGMDPHYWLSTENAKVIAENIANKFIEMDPVNKEYYVDNLGVFLEDMDMLASEIEALFSGLTSRELIVFHESWNYFAAEFGLEVAGVFTPSPGKEPSPQYMKELYDRAEEHNIKAVFSEPQLSPESIKPFIDDLGLKLFVLDPLGGGNGRASFRDMLMYNAETIYHALKE